MSIAIDQIIRSRRRTIGFRITRDGKLVVRAPHFVSTSYIHSLIQGKQSWIEKHQKSRRPSHHFNEGELFFYLGNQYPLSFSTASKKTLALSDQFYLNDTLSKEKRRDAFVHWYKTQAKDIIPDRVHIWSQKMGLSPQKIRITSAQTRWGSCNAQKTVSFSWRLIMAPMGAIDYVVVHELAHLQHLNHSKSFWRQVESALPDFKTPHRWLRENGAKFSL